MSEFASGAGRAVCYCGDERVPNTGRTDRPARSPSCQPPASTRYIFPEVAGSVGSVTCPGADPYPRIHTSVGSGCRSGRPKNIRILRIRMRIRNTGTFTSFFKDKKWKKLQKIVEIKVFLTIFCLMMEGSGAGSILVTNGSGCGSGRPENIRIRIPNTGRGAGPAFVGECRIGSCPALGLRILTVCLCLIALIFLNVCVSLPYLRKKYSILDPHRSGSYNLQCLNKDSDLVFNHARSKDSTSMHSLLFFSKNIFLPIWIKFCKFYT